MRDICQFAAVLFAGFILSACAPIAAPPVETTPETIPAGLVAAEDGTQEASVPNSIGSQDTVTAAQADLARYLSIPVEEIDLLEVRAVTWPDTSLGCGEPGEVYAQGTQEGLLIRLRAGERMYFYHSGSDGLPFLCERTSQLIPGITPDADEEFVPPPDSEID